MTLTVGTSIFSGAGAAGAAFGASSFQITVVMAKAMPAAITSSMQ